MKIFDPTTTVTSPATPPNSPKLRKSPTIFRNLSNLSSLSDMSAASDNSFTAAKTPKPDSTPVPAILTRTPSSENSPTASELKKSPRILRNLSDMSAASDNSFTEAISSMPTAPAGRFDYQAPEESNPAPKPQKQAKTIFQKLCGHLLVK